MNARRVSLAPKTLAVAVAALLAVAFATASYLVGVWPRLENDTIDLRFALRGAVPASGVTVVAIDDKTFSDLGLQWPFPRRLDGQVIERLRKDGARTIAYDVQFTEPTDERNDRSLYRAIGRARNVVLATTEVDSHGHTAVLGGDANLHRARAVAAAANLPAESDGVIRRYPYKLLGLSSFAVAAVNAAGDSISRRAFERNRALIDFRGPPGAMKTVSFSDVLRGRIDPAAFSGRIVVVGATAPTLQDLHATSTTSQAPMAGPEIQANAIWTGLHENPLRPAPGWLTLLAIVLLGASAPLASLRARVFLSAALGLALAAGFALLVQVAFESGWVLVATYPLAAWAFGTLGMLVANYIAAFAERNAFARQLRASQLELIQRLAQAVETRDTETGEHVQRIGELCRAVALELGWTPEQAERIRHASAMHDIGKIGIPDSVLLKPGSLSAEEWDVIRSHTVVGAGILAGSANPLVQMAEEIARCHHERWDGGGYPAGLKGEEIPLAARICTIADVYDALLSKRSYKDAWTPEQTLAELRSQSGTQFDPALVEVFLRIAPALTDEPGRAPDSVGAAARSREGAARAIPPPGVEPESTV